jgi:hypothetical protein
MKRVALIAAALLALGAGIAVAGPSKPPRFSTTITVDHVAVSPNGTIVASGRVRSEVHRCDRFREIDLVRTRPGPDKLLDIGISSIGGGEWAVRSQPGAADGSKLAVRAPRQWQGSESILIGPNGHVIRRTRHVKRICKAGRARVDYIQ